MTIRYFENSADLQKHNAHILTAEINTDSKDEKATKASMMMNTFGVPIRNQ